MASSATFDTPLERSVGETDSFDHRQIHGTSGGFPAHRAVRRLAFCWRDFLLNLGVCIAASLAWLALLPSVCRLWALLLGSALEHLHLDASVMMRPYALWDFELTIPFIEMLSLPPDWSVWWETAIACALLFALSYRLSQDCTPLAYLLRFALIIQASALAYFAAIPARFPHGASDFIAGTMAAGVVLIGLVPAIFTLTFYVFEFSLWRKMLLTVLTMSHLAVFVPLQALAHAYVLHHSLMFMPILFLLFGMPLQILIFVSFYSWGMSWKARQ